MRTQDEPGGVRSGPGEHLDNFFTHDAMEASLSSQDVTLEPGLFGWDNLQLSLWDSFPFFE